MGSWNWIFKIPFSYYFYDFHGIIDNHISNFWKITGKFLWQVHQMRLILRLLLLLLLSLSSLSSFPSFIVSFLMSFSDEPTDRRTSWWKNRPSEYLTIDRHSDLRSFLIKNHEKDFYFTTTKKISAQIRFLAQTIDPTVCFFFSSGRLHSSAPKKAARFLNCCSGAKKRKIKAQRKRFQFAMTKNEGKPQE